MHVPAMVVSSALITGHRFRTSAPSITSCVTLFAFHSSSVFLRKGSSFSRMMTSPVS
jgi:hypothetical protein